MEHHMFRLYHAVIFALLLVTPAAGAIVIESKSTGTTSNGTSVTVTKPSGLADNDVLLAFVSKDDDVDMTPPGSWIEITNAGTLAGNDMRLAVYYKVIPDAASEGFSYIWSGDRELWRVLILRLSGVDNDTPLDVAASHENYENDTSPLSTEVTTATDGALVFAVAYTDTFSNGITGPSGTTLVNSYDDANTLEIRHFTQATAGDTGDKEWTGVTSSAESHVVLVAIRPFVESGGGGRTRRVF
jgi:hypothetical protein